MIFGCAHPRNKGIPVPLLPHERCPTFFLLLDTISTISTEHGTALCLAPSVLSCQRHCVMCRVGQSLVCTVFLAGKSPYIRSCTIYKYIYGSGQPWSCFNLYLSALCTSDVYTHTHIRTHIHIHTSAHTYTHSHTNTHYIRGGPLPDSLLPFALEAAQN